MCKGTCLLGLQILILNFDWLFKSNFFAWLLTLSLKSDLYQIPVWTIFGSDVTHTCRRKRDITRSALFKEVNMSVHMLACVTLKWLCDQNQLYYLTSSLDIMFIFNLASWRLLRCRVEFLERERRSEGKNKLKYWAHHISMDTIDTNVSIICCCRFTVIQDMGNLKDKDKN